MKYSIRELCTKELASVGPNIEKLRPSKPFQNRGMDVKENSCAY